MKFSVKNTLECGQFFRYKKIKSGYIVQTRDKVFFINQNRSEGVNKTFIDEFFNLNHEINLKLSKRDEDLRPFFTKTNLRIINQDVWECLISFVCSSASNIPKIQRNIENLSRHFGNKTTFQGKTYYTFPQIGKINNLEKIKESGTGYRAKYIYEINNIVNKKWIDDLRKLNYEDARSKLKELPGVGDKIADCVCLFSLKHHESFPIDVWMKRVLEERYNVKGNYDTMRIYAKKHFGKDAGWIQQYLYHYRRNFYK